MRTNLFLILIAVFVISCLFPIKASASWFNIKKKKQELYRLQQRLKEERERLGSANHREREIAEQLKSIRERLSSTKEQLYQLASRLRFTESEIKAAKSRLKHLENVRSIKEVQLSHRMFVSYQSGSMNILGLILGAKNLTDFLNRLNFMGIIINSDLNLIKEIKTKKEAVDTEKRLLENKYHEIVTIKRNMNTQQIMESNIENRREQLLYGVQTERKAIANQVYELEETNEKLEAELQELIRREQAKRKTQSGVIFSGSFVWPAKSSYITSPFGWRRHPILGNLRFHTGTDIASDHGSPIKASGDGHVIYSGWYGGYGNAVVLDHGGGLSTLYAHCSALYVSVGQDVKKGQTIAAIGSTGMANGPHLHFEVRQNGTPVDPMGKF